MCNVLNLVGACAPTAALHTRLAVPLTSKLDPEQFVALFAENEQIQTEGYYRVNRTHYLRQLIFRTMPGDTTDVRETALLLAKGRVAPAHLEPAAPPSPGRLPRSSRRHPSGYLRDLGHLL